MLQCIQEIADRFGVQETFINYFRSINTSSSVIIHSHLTLERYLSRGDILTTLDDIGFNYRAVQPNINNIEEYLIAMKSGIIFLDFYEHFKPKLPFEVIERMYLDPKSYASYLYGEYIVSQLFTVEYGRKINEIVEYLAYYLLSPSTSIGANLKDVMDKYGYIISAYNFDTYCKIEIFRRLQELEQTLYNLMNNM